MTLAKVARIRIFFIAVSVLRFWSPPSASFSPSIAFYKFAFRQTCANTTWTALFNETLAGIALILGLFTRFFAAAAAIELLIITAVYWHTGFSWLRQGYEYTLLWGWVCFAIALRGGGPYSIDRAIGKEL
jgi:putative oxidoreductase